MRILHVVGGMVIGGTETWLLNVLRRAGLHDLQMDFLVHTSEPRAFDDEIRNLGSLVIPCLNPSRPMKYALNFRRVMGEYGPYDVLHSHVHYYSGYTLWLARAGRARTLVAHSHTDTMDREKHTGKSRHAYSALMKQMVSRYADYGLAASRKAAEDLFGPDWQEDPRWRILYCGIDLEPFKRELDRQRVRAELGIPEKAFVVGHVARFTEEKNHIFLIDIASEVARVAEDACFLLVGDGPLRPAIEQKVESLGLQGRVIFAGERPDVPELMLGAMDAFILPSLYEGLPLVLIEAQAAGLPCMFSDVITDEADIVNHLMKRLPTNRAATTWAAAIVDLRRKQPPTKDPKAVTLVEHSAFNITESAEELFNFYEDASRGVLRDSQASVESRTY